MNILQKGLYARWDRDSIMAWHKTRQRGKTHFLFLFGFIKICLTMFVSITIAFYLADNERLFGDIQSSLATLFINFMGSLIAGLLMAHYYWKNTDDSYNVHMRRSKKSLHAGGFSRE